MSEHKQHALSQELLAAIGDYGHAKYRHDNDIVTLGAWEDLITAIKVWNNAALAAKEARISELEAECARLKELAHEAGATVSRLRISGRLRARPPGGR